MGRRTYVQRRRFKGLGFGVEVNMGYIFGSGSWEIKDSLTDGGDRFTAPRDVALGGRITGWYALMNGPWTGPSEVFPSEDFGATEDAKWSIPWGFVFTGVVGCESGIWDGLSGDSSFEGSIWSSGVLCLTASELLVPFMMRTNPTKGAGVEDRA